MPGRAATFAICFTAGKKPPTPKMGKRMGKREGGREQPLH